MFEDIKEEDIKKPTEQQGDNLPLFSSEGWRDWVSTLPHRFSPLSWKYLLGEVQQYQERGPGGVVSDKLFNSDGRVLDTEELKRNINTGDLYTQAMNLGRKAVAEGGNNAPIKTPFSNLGDTLNMARITNDVVQLLPDSQIATPLKVVTSLGARAMDEIVKGAKTGVSDFLNWVSEGGKKLLSSDKVDKELKEEVANQQTGTDLELEKLTVKPSSYTMKLADDVTNSLMMMAPALAIGMKFGTGASLSTMFIASSGMAYRDARKQGMDPETASRIAEVKGAGEALTELLPVEALLEKTGAGFLHRLFKSTAADLPGEMISTAIDSAIDKVYTNPNMTMKDFLQAELDTVLSTLIQAPIVTGAMHKPVEMLGEAQIKKLDAKLRKEGFDFDSESLLKAYKDGTQKEFLTSLEEKRKIEIEERVTTKLNNYNEILDQLDSTGNKVTQMIAGLARKKVEERDTIQAGDLITKSIKALSQEEFDGVLSKYMEKKAQEVATISKEAETLSKEMQSKIEVGKPKDTLTEEELDFTKRLQKRDNNDLRTAAELYDHNINLTKENLKTEKDGKKKAKQTEALSKMERTLQLITEEQNKRKSGAQEILPGLENEVERLAKDVQGRQKTSVDEGGFDIAKYRITPEADSHGRMLIRSKETKHHNRINFAPEDGFLKNNEKELGLHNFLEVENIAVIGAKQQGEGHEMMNIAEEIARKKGKDQVALLSVPESVGFYEKLGYRKVVINGEVQKYGQDFGLQEDGLTVMVKDLKTSPSQEDYIQAEKLNRKLLNPKEQLSDKEKVLKEELEAKGIEFADKKDLFTSKKVSEEEQQDLFDEPIKKEKKTEGEWKEYTEQDARRRVMDVAQSETVVENYIKKGKLELAKEALKSVEDKLKEFKEDPKDLFAKEALEENGLEKRIKEYKEAIRLIESKEETPIRLYSNRGVPYFRSKLEQALVSLKQETWKGEDLWNYLVKSAQVKPGELEYFKLEEFLKSHDKVTLSHVKNMMRELMPNIISIMHLEKTRSLQGMIESFKQGQDVIKNADYIFDNFSEDILTLLNGQAGAEVLTKELFYDSLTQLTDDDLYNIANDHPESTFFESMIEELKDAEYDPEIITKLELHNNLIIDSIAPETLEQYRKNKREKKRFTLYKGYTPSKGKNYREEVFVIEGSEERSSHFPGIKGNIGWILIDETHTSETDKSLNIIEIQNSEWTEDTLRTKKEVKKIQENYSKLDLIDYFLSFNRRQGDEAYLLRLNELGTQFKVAGTFEALNNYLHSLPFKELQNLAVEDLKKKAREATMGKSTPEYMFKNFLVRAVKEGFTSITWPTAEAIGKRYGKPYKSYDGWVQYIEGLSKKYGWKIIIKSTEDIHKVSITPEMAKWILTDGVFELFANPFSSKHSFFGDSHPIQIEKIVKASNVKEVVETLLSKDHPWKDETLKEMVQKITEKLGMSYLESLVVIDQEDLMLDEELIPGLSVRLSNEEGTPDALVIHEDFIKNNKIEFINEVLTHELVHLAISRSLKADETFKKEVQRIQREVWNSLSKKQRVDVEEYNRLLREIHKNNTELTRNNMERFLDSRGLNFDENIAYSFYNLDEFIANFTTVEDLRNSYGNMPWYKQLWHSLSRAIFGKSYSKTVGERLQTLLLNNVRKFDRVNQTLIGEKGERLDYSNYKDIVELPSIKDIRRILENFKDVSDYYNGVNTILEAKDQARERFNAFLMVSVGKILPMSAIMKQSSFRRAYEFGMSYTEGYEVDKFYILSKALKNLLKSIPKAAKNKMFDYIEDSETLIPAEHMEAVQKVKDFVASMFSYIKESGYPDILNLEEVGPNFLPHVFDRFKVEIEEGDPTYYRSLYEAIEGAKALELQGETILDIRPEISSDALDVFVSNKKMQATITKLSEDLALDRDEAMELLREAGIKGDNARLSIEGLVKHKEELAYRRDFEDVLTFWTQRVVRAVNQNKYLENMQGLLDRVKDQKAKVALKDYMDRTLGRPWAIETAIADFWNLFSPLKERTAYDVRALSQYFSAVQYISDLGFMMSSALTNFTQIIMNTAPMVGLANTTGASLKALKALTMKKEEYHELLNQGILQEVDMATESKYSRTLTFPLALFQLVERFNRATTYFAGKQFVESKGRIKAQSVLKLLGVPSTASIFLLTKDLDESNFSVSFAKELVNNTQFRGEAFNAPTLFSSPVTKLITPYKTFMINQFTFMFRLMRHAIGNSDEARKAFGKFLLFSLLLAGEKANPLVQGLVGMMDLAYKNVFGKSLKDEGIVGRIVEAGVPSIIGIDMSNAIAFYNPTDIFTGVIPRMIKAGKALAIGDEKKAWQEIGPRFVKSLENTWNIASKGEYRDKEGRMLTLFEEEKKREHVVQALTGFKPTEVLKYYRLKEMDMDSLDWYRENVTERVDEWTEATLKEDYTSADRIIDKMAEKLETLGKMLEKAEEGSSYEAEIGKKYMLLRSALSKNTLFKNSIEKRLIPAPYREPRRAFKTYNIPLMEEFKGDSEEIEKQLVSMMFRSS